jgi:fermentation-respiration switch protein FrsA (DUF1100 family)
MADVIEREKVRFHSGRDECAAWHYPGTNGACLIMAGGFAVPKEPGTDQFAQRFHAAGFSVLAFDYRRLGESGGQPRLVLPIKSQLADWQAALEFAATLPEVDPTRIAIWGFSATGGHIFRVAAGNPQVAVAVAQTPNADGLAATRSAAKFQSPLAMLRLTGRGLLDAVGGWFGRAPKLVPLVGPRGSVAMLSTPDAFDGDRALRAQRYPDWQQAVAARSVLAIGSYRPGRAAARVTCPLLVVVCDQDQTALAEPAVRAVARAARGELVRFPGGHYAPFLEQHEAAVAAELVFLRQHL